MNSANTVVGSWNLKVHMDAANRERVRWSLQELLNIVTRKCAPRYRAEVAELASGITWSRTDGLTETSPTNGWL